MNRLPEPYYERGGITIYHADNRDVLPFIEQTSAVVTDPPYGLSFMGKGWDHQVPGVEFWQAISEAMLPGAHLLAFGGTRTYHRMAVAIEDAGYEIRDTLQWLYGSGFPKSHDVSKAIDKMAGAEREVVGKRDRYRDGRDRNDLGPVSNLYEHGLEGRNGYNDITAPATPEAEQWQGWGTALKPAYEPIIMARLPFKGTVAANVLAHGTGAINIDGSRIGGNTWVDEDNLCSSCAEDAVAMPKPITPETRASTAPSNAALTLNGRAESSQHDTSKTDTGCCDGPSQAGQNTDLYTGSSLSTAVSGKNSTAPSLTDTSSTTSTTIPSTTASRTCNSCGAMYTHPTTTRAGQKPGRWPSNIILDEEAAAMLDAQSGVTTSGAAGRKGSSGFVNGYNGDYSVPYGDTGGASRFFYVAKASRRERNAGLEGMPAQINGRNQSSFDGGTMLTGSGNPRNTGTANHHPTVKPLALMRYLIQMVTPPGGIVLDPFMGSGSTLVAAAELGFRAIGIELSEEYAEIAARRVDHAIEQQVLPLEVVS